MHGDYSPLDFDVKPYELKPGARYVIGWSKASAIHVGDGEVVRIPAEPIRFLTVTKVLRHRKGFWRALFEVTDLRDRDVFLRRGGGDSPVDELKAGAKPRWTPSMVTRAKTVNEFWHQERLKRYAEERRLRGQARIRRAA